MPFNASQCEACEHFKGPCLVLAGPGSGKTAVIVRRIEILLEKHKIPPSEILVITFTRAAATEMRERFLYHRHGSSAPVTFGTFHSFFYQILRSERPSDNRRVLAEGERLALFKACLREVYPQKICPPDTVASLLSHLSVIKNHGAAGFSHQATPAGPKELAGKIPPGTLKRQELPSLSAGNAAPATGFDLKKLDAAFSKIKKRENVYDFDDLLTETYALLLKNPAARERFRTRYRFLLIDEFQDSATRFAVKSCNV